MELGLENVFLALAYCCVQDLTSNAGVISSKRPSDSKTPETAAMLKKALQSVLFTDSSSEELDKVLLVMKRHVLEKGDFAIKQGDSGDLFYVIQSGELEVIVNTVVVGSLKTGDHFGELALIYDGTCFVAPISLIRNRTSHSRTWCDV